MYCDCAVSKEGGERVLNFSEPPRRKFCKGAEWFVCVSWCKAESGGGRRSFIRIALVKIHEDLPSCVFLVLR